MRHIHDILVLGWCHLFLAVSNCLNWFLNHFLLLSSWFSALRLEVIRVVVCVFRLFQLSLLNWLSAWILSIRLFIAALSHHLLFLIWLLLSRRSLYSFKVCFGSWIIWILSQSAWFVTLIASFCILKTSVCWISIHLPVQCLSFDRLLRVSLCHPAFSFIIWLRQFVC